MSSKGEESAVPTVPAPPASSSPWPDRLWVLATSLPASLARPRVRLTVIGVVLLLVGGLFVTSSIWTLPLVILGALMVVIAWVGCRLDGRFAVEWGETGTQLEFRAKIKAAQSALPALTALPAVSTSARALVSLAAPEPEPEPEDAEIVEGEAHTVEIEVAELNALIAAAETAEAVGAQPDASAQAIRNLRVAHAGGRSPEAAR